MNSLIVSAFWFLLIGLGAGWLAGLIVKGAGFGIKGNLIVGVLGALLGGFLFDLVGLSASTRIASLIAATAGAIALLFIIGFLSRATGGGR